MKENWKNGVLYYTFPDLEAQSFLLHGFSSRLGGVSSGVLGTMNLSYSRGDAPENVDENFRRIAAAIGFSTEEMVFSHQTHTANVRVVTKTDCGNYRRGDFWQNVDGLITNTPGVVLSTFYADCVPLFFADPVRRTVGLSHSGWRGTVGDIAGATVKKMQEAFGSDPKDILACIGPSICQDCYEVSRDVIGEFQKKYEKVLWSRLFYQKPGQEMEGKAQLSLQTACEANLLAAGIQAEHITYPDLCTCCTPDILFSHRASRGARGNLAGFIAIRDNPHLDR